MINTAAPLTPLGSGLILETTMRDVIYILRENIEPYELTYSLRSLEKNFPCGKVYFIGGKPKGLEPDRAHYHRQIGTSKWSRIPGSLKIAAEDPELSDEFFVFNDDFFIMKPIDTNNFINYISGTLNERYDEIMVKRTLPSNYQRELQRCDYELYKRKATRFSFEVHIPILVNKADLCSMIDEIIKSRVTMYRSFYGNMAGVETIRRKDCKFYDLETVIEDSDYLSTNDEVFKRGAIGHYIRDQFTEPSRFEV